MIIPPKSAELLRSPESQKYKSIAAICVCRCMATWFPQNMVWLSGLLGLPCTWPFTCTFSEHICPAQNPQSCQHIRYSSLELPYPFMVISMGFPIGQMDKKHWNNHIKQFHVLDGFRGTASLQIFPPRGRAKPPAQWRVAKSSLLRQLWQLQRIKMTKLWKVAAVY